MFVLKDWYVGAALAVMSYALFQLSFSPAAIRRAEIEAALLTGNGDGDMLIEVAALR